MPAEKFAFATLVTSDHYLPGALAVAAALKEVHSSATGSQIPFQLVCIVSPETVDISTIKHLRKAFDVVIGVEAIEATSTAELQLLGRPDLHSVLTKLHVFRLTQYDKVVFLDADILPLRPLSHLFMLPHEFSAVPDVGWPDIFNSGMMVLTPGDDEFSDIMRLVKSRGSWDGGDQGILNDWRRNIWHRLSFIYNTTPTATYTYAPAYQRFGRDISALHFIGPNKPWNAIPYRAPFSLSEHPQDHLQAESQISGLDVSSAGSVSTHASQLSYSYSSLVDRWFDVYDRNYRALHEPEEHRRDIRTQGNGGFLRPPAAGQSFSIAKTAGKTRVLGLDELKDLALKGGTIIPRKNGEGEYRSLPLEGRIDLMRPKPSFPMKTFSSETQVVGAHVSQYAQAPDETVTQAPTLSQDGQQVSYSAQQHRVQYQDASSLVSTPDAEAKHALESPFSVSMPLPKPQALEYVLQSPIRTPQPPPQPAPLVSDVSPLLYHQFSSSSTSMKSSVHDSVSMTTRMFPPQHSLSIPTDFHIIAHDESDESGDILGLPLSYEANEPEDSTPPQNLVVNAERPPRSHSPPLLRWNPAIEPPPKAIPSSSAFRTDSHYFNAWDIPSNSQNLHMALTGSPSSASGFFEPPSLGHIPERLLKEGHYSNIIGQQSATASPQPDLSRVSPIFPWERTPRHMPTRTFPKNETTPPGIMYIEETSSTENDVSESIREWAAQQPEEGRPLSTQLPQMPLPSGYPGSRTYTNAWDTVPSIQNYAAKLVKPPTVAPPPLLQPANTRRRSVSGGYTDKAEQSDVSMDGDVEDEVDDESDTNTHKHTSSNENSDNAGTRNVVRGGRFMRKGYRSYGVQTVPKDVRSVAVQVSQTAFTGKSRAPEMSPEDMPNQPSVLELSSGLEQTVVLSPDVTETLTETWPYTLGGQQQQRGSSTGSSTPRIDEDRYKISASAIQSEPYSPSRKPNENQPKGAHRSAVNTQAQSPSAVARSSSTDSTAGPATPADSVASTSTRRKPAGRSWNPATGVDVFKRASEEVLTRFMRMGSWGSQSK